MSDKKVPGACDRDQKFRMIGTTFVLPSSGSALKKPEKRIAAHLANLVGSIRRSEEEILYARVKLEIITRTT